MKDLPDIRPSPIAGLWYDDDPGTLGAEIDGFLASAQVPDLPGQVVGVIAPHAGYRYSGPVAGYAFRPVLGKPVDLVAVLSPMHRPYSGQGEGRLLTTAHQAYQTPLGTVEVDANAVARFEQEIQRAGLELDRVALDEEHSLEIELPFLQRCLAPGARQQGFTLLPLMLRDQSPGFAKEVGAALAHTLQDRMKRGDTVLLVASSDLSHFYPVELANVLDTEALHQVQAFSPEGLFQAARTGKAQACGLNAVAAVLWAARELGADRVRLLHYATSGDVTGDRSSVVGYGAAVVLKSPPKRP
jgi:AmmeMemoRadiSam system protein B